MTNVTHNDGSMKIRISQLSRGVHEYHFSSDPATIGLEPAFRKSVLVEAVLEKTTRQLYLKADIHTTGHFQCDRCVEEFDYELSTKLNMFYVFDALETGKHHVDEVQVISPDTVHLDLTDDVRQTVTLAVPLKLLCRDECRGLCPHCGTNWNNYVCECKDEISDQRLTDLEKFLKN